MTRQLPISCCFFSCKQISQAIQLYGTHENFLHNAMYTLFLLSVPKFPAVLVAMLGSTIPISIIGAKFAMSVTPFWTPTQFSKVDHAPSRLSFQHTNLDTSFYSF